MKGQKNGKSDTQLAIWYPCPGPRRAGRRL